MFPDVQRSGRMIWKCCDAYAAAKEMNDLKTVWNRPIASSRVYINVLCWSLLRFDRFCLTCTARHDRKLAMNEQPVFLKVRSLQHTVYTMTITDAQWDAVAILNMVLSAVGGASSIFMFVAVL